MTISLFQIRESELTQTHTVYSQIEKLIPVPGIYATSVSPNTFYTRKFYLASDDLPVLPPTQCKSPNLTWTAFSDQYFEGGFEPPFSEPEDSEDSSQSVDGDCEKSREVVTLPESPNSLDIDEENSLDTSQSSQRYVNIVCGIGFMWRTISLPLVQFLLVLVVSL